MGRPSSGSMVSLAAPHPARRINRATASPSHPSRESLSQQPATRPSSRVPVATASIEPSIHMDPVVRDGRTEGLRRQVADIARELDPALTIHDFRTTAGPIHTNVLFDVVVHDTSYYSANRGAWVNNL